MTKSEKKFIFAATHAQARHYAQTMDWARSEWEFLNKPQQLLGLHSIVVYEVRVAQKRDPSEQESHRAMRDAIDAAVESSRIARLNVVNMR